MVVGEGFLLWISFFVDLRLLGPGVFVDLFV